VNIWNRVKLGLPANIAYRRAVPDAGITLAVGATEAALVAYIRAVESQKRAV
jgi:hypothetical protein